jgi:hypothetical protein
VKVDLKKELKQLYAAPMDEFTLVTVPPLGYLMVDGHGNPNTSPDYVAAIEVLYAVAYALKFFSKVELERDYVVPPLEGLWWADDFDAFRSGKKDDWDWSMMILVPDWLTAAHVSSVVEKVAAKKPDLRVDTIRFESLNEGLSVQTMHIGSYDNEGPTLIRLHDEFLPAQGLRESGKHHEIYLSDPRRTESSQLKTILRQPVDRT